MAGPYHGKTGHVKFNDSAIASLGSWDFTTSIDVADTTPMGAVNDWETQETGLSDFSGTAEGLAAKGLGTVALVGADQSVVFTLNNGADNGDFEGNAIITSLTETVNIDDVGKVAYSFEGNDGAGLSFSAGSGDDPAFANSFHGKNARVLWNDLPMLKPKEWAVTVTSGTADSTAMSINNNGRTRLAGFKAGTATFTNLISDSGFADSAGTAIALGDKQGIEFWRTSSNSDGGYSGTAEITGRDVSTNKDGVEESTYTIKFNGAVSNTIS